jgi:hypothetical protein
MNLPEKEEKPSLEQKAGQELLAYRIRSQEARR